MTAISCKNVCKELGTDVRTPVLRGIHFEIPKGEFVALTGASGSGKSTLLYVLGALDRPTSGETYIGGQEVGGLGESERARVRLAQLGFVFQFHFLLPEFTVLENVEIPMMRQGIWNSSQVRERATKSLASLGLGELLARKPHQLSGGQQQRVSIARAISHGPEVLLADEPTGNLDSSAGQGVIGIFESLAREQGMTIVMVTHEHAFAERTDREIRLRDGVIDSDRVIRSVGRR